MVFGRKKKKDAEAEAIMDAVLTATGEEDLMADPDTPKPKTAKKKSSSSKEKKGKQVTDNPLVLYGEKIALTLAFVASGYLIYSGLNAGKNQSGQTFDKTTEQLEQQIQAANSAISGGDWDQEKETFVVDNDQSFEQRSTAGQVNISAADYGMSRLLSPPVNRNTKKREDPELYTATDLLAHAVTGPVAYTLPEGAVDPTGADEPAILEKPEEKKKTTRPKRGKNNNDPFAGGGIPGMDGGDMGDMAGMGGMMGGMMGGDASGGTGAIRRLRTDRGQIMGYRPSGNAIGGMGAMGGMGDMAGPMGGAMGGMEGGMGGAMGGMEGGVDTGSDEEKGTPVAVAQTIVGVTALVPFKKQFDEFERTLAMRSGYDARRDRPDYIYMTVQRVDITDNPQQAEGEYAWANLLNTKAHNIVAEKWHGTAGEIVDSTHLNEYISLSCPPVMLRDINDLLRHPEIPLAGQAPTNEVVPEEETDDEPEETVDSNIPGSGRKPKRNNNADGGMMGGMGGAMGGMGDMSGMGGMGGAMGGMGDMSGMGMGGMMGGMGGDMGALLSADIPDYKMVRFFDFSAKIGRTYRYRVQLWLEDPNLPNTNAEDEYPDHRPPSEQTLNADALNRVKALKAGDNAIPFYRLTEWSQPCEAITIPNPTMLAAGSVEAARESRSPTGQTYVDAEPTGTIKPIVFDPKRAVDVPFDRSVNRGALLNFTADAEYGHPILEVINGLPGFEFQTDIMVGDLRGGDQLFKGTNYEKMFEKDNIITAPGEFILFDKDGNLLVHSEIDDVKLWQRYNYQPDATEDNTGGGMGGMGGPMGGMDGGMGGMMDPGGGDGGIPGM